MSTILLIDDEHELLEIIEQFLIRYGHKVLKAYDGSEAMEMLQNHEVNIIITDLIMPGISGVELVRELKLRGGDDLPIIVMTGQVMGEGVTEVLAEGINAYIEKPFNRNVLLNTISRIEQNDIVQLKNSIKQIDDERFVRVSIDDFISNSNPPYDLYIKFSHSKYLKILNRGAELTVERILRYRQKDLTHMYVKKSDYKRFLLDKLNIAPDKTMGERKKTERTKTLMNLYEVVLDDLYMKDIDRDIYESSVEFSKLSVETVLGEHSLFTLLSDLEQYSNPIYKHSAGVNLLSVMLSKKLSWLSEDNILNLSLAGIYHDVGKKWIAKDILNNEGQLIGNGEALQQFKKHPEFSAQMLSEIPSVPKEVLEIVVQHHEKYSGGGYPNNLSGSRINPLARMLCVVNNYCNLAIDSGKKVNEGHEFAMKEMITNGKDYDPEIFNAFVEMFNA